MLVTIAGLLALILYMLWRIAMNQVQKARQDAILNERLVKAINRLKENR